MSAWATGIQLGPYVLLSQLGAGGMGEVWKARDTRLNRIVAVKRLKSKHSTRFEQEARAIAALNHPNICQIFDIGPDYLVLEYIEGAPLAGPAPVAKAIRLAKQIAEALDAAHRKGVIHRDLKPANILVTTEGAVKLLDFGLAKQIADADETLTLEGTVVGTAAYMSPEQAAGKRIDTRSDIFSFGAVLYELLSGRRAFSGENSASTMAAILHKEPAPLDAPPALQQIVKRCLAKAPGERFQTMAEVVTALESEPEQPARPSVAVLPFANMSGDKENEYFSDGLAEEIINALAQIPGLKVTARTSAFAFRGKETDIRKIAEALDVRTILEGSVRRAGSRIRVTACLINAADGSHLWVQRYDRDLGYLLPAGRAVEAVKQADGLLQEDPLNLFFRVFRAWSLFAAGRDDEACEEARKLLDLDPGVGPAYQVLVAGHVLRGELEQALAFAERACQLPRILPEAAGNLAGLLERMGERQRAEEILQGAPAGDAFGGARARAAFNWACGNVDATADWIENAIDQRDAAAPFMPRLWYGRALRSTPHWPRLMRKLNLPEAAVAPTP
jgi:TolB-like protein/tRNA A-37 threonylcarbamoyl transferase component Bud32